MTGPDAHLALWLEGPLQSWGFQSRFDRRTTRTFPTRSGIVGLLAAALGVDRSDVPGLRRLDALRLTVYVCRNSGIATDFHTVGGGYGRTADPRHIARTADGNVGSTVVTRREYLQDAAFAVIAAGPVALVRDVGTALQDPHWGLWLGRRSCFPSVPVYQGEYPDEAEARARLRTVAQARARTVIRVVREVSDFAAGTDTLTDQPLDFAAREFAPRRIADELLEGGL